MGHYVQSFRKNSNINEVNKASLRLLSVGKSRQIYKKKRLEMFHN